MTALDSFCGAERFGLRRPGFDAVDDGVGSGPTDGLQGDGSGDDQVVDAALEVSRCQVGIQVRARACGAGVDIAVARQCVASDAELLCRPCEYVCCALKLGFADGLLLEVAFTKDQEVSGGVVFSVGVTGDCVVA